VRRNKTGRASFIKHADGALSDKYDVGNKLGEGTQGVVFIAQRKVDGAARAVKQVLKSSLRQAETKAFFKEIDIMKSMDHPNIVKLYDTFEDKKFFFLVMEVCSGGELLDRIIAQGFSESQAAIVVKQVLRAVFYMHENDIVHRDLKPENFLLGENGPIAEDNLLKLIDFGIACECKPGQVLTEKKGTAFYVAPQVISRRYDNKCDLWSVGVIMYTLITGNVPFHGVDDLDTLTKVRAGLVRYDDKDWGKVSAEAKDFCKALLKRNPKLRIAAEDALNHPWIKVTAPQRHTALPSSFLTKLSEFRNLNIVKKAALQIVAGELDDDALKNMRDVFLSMDENGDGKLTVDEIRHGIQNAGIEIPQNLVQILEGVDADGSGIVDYTEFLAATLDSRSHLSEQVCRQAFAKFDRDGDGQIRVEELMHALAGGSSYGGRQFEEESIEIIKKYDESGTGIMTFEGFQQMMQSTTREISKEISKEPSKRMLSEKVISGRGLADIPDAAAVEDESDDASEPPDDSQPTDKAKEAGLVK